MSTKRYSDEFKTEAIKMVLDGKMSQNQIADELGVAGTTLSGWVRKYNLNSRKIITWMAGLLPSSYTSLPASWSLRLLGEPSLDFQMLL